MDRLSTIRFLGEQFAALATSIVAACIANTAVIPDAVRLSVVFVAALNRKWIGGVHGSTIAVAFALGWGGLAPEPGCFYISGTKTVSTSSAVPIIIMLRDVDVICGKSA